MVSRIPGINELMWNSAFEMTWILTNKVKRCKHIATCSKNMELENLNAVSQLTHFMTLLSFLTFLVVIERDQ